MPERTHARALAACAKGRIGEHIAAAAVEGMGWRVMLAPTEWIDLVAIRGPRTLRVQVKAAFPTEDASRPPRYQFKNGGRSLRCDPEDVDILALVALDQRSVRFTLPPPQRMVSVRPELFTPQAEVETWQEVCDLLAGGNRARKL